MMLPDYQSGNDRLPQASPHVDPVLSFEVDLNNGDFFDGKQNSRITFLPIRRYNSFLASGTAAPAPERVSPD